MEIRVPFGDVFEDSVASDSHAEPSSSSHYIATERSPQLHVLIPASETNDRLCKTLLSSFLLNYPSPTLINFGKVFTGDTWDKGSHAGKIGGVYDFLSKDEKVYDGDLVLVIDGYDVWFQLPPEVLVKRYITLIRAANKRLQTQYGFTLASSKEPAARRRDETVQKYTQTVIFGADKLCWPNASDEPACASLPESILPPDVYGPETDKDSEGFKNRPKYLNSGALIGPVNDVRAIYERALEKIGQGRGAVGDQFIFAEILGEQEHSRQKFLATAATPCYVNPFGDLFPSISYSNTANMVGNSTSIVDQDLEFSAGLDYTSSLFQTMTHSADDIRYIVFSNTSHSDSGSSPEELPPDILSARLPFPVNDLFNNLTTNTIIPLSFDLDSLPAIDSNTWNDVQLAVNRKSTSSGYSTVPTLLHVNGDKSILDSWWPSMWYQQYARALLRQYIRTPQPFIWGSTTGKDTMWDLRGGRGGVWTADGRWSEWGRICQGVERTVFGDDKGIWGEEAGDGRTWNYWGQQVTGKVELLGAISHENVE